MIDNGNIAKFSHEKIIIKRSPLTGRNYFDMLVSKKEMAKNFSKIRIKLISAFVA